MNDKIKRGLLVTGAVAALAGGGAAIAGAAGNPGDTPSASPATSAEHEAPGARDDESGRDDGEGTPVTGSELDRASAVALDATGGGQVTGSEKNDEEGYYEIEVTRDDGSEVDVHLDRNLDVLSTEADG
jgi:uncharacterized membrane protein YkoI